MTTKKFVPVVDYDRPVPKKSPSGTYSEALRTVKVGGSMWLPCSRETGAALGRKEFGKGKYVSRRESKDGQAGCRVWRSAE